MFNLKKICHFLIFIAKKQTFWYPKDIYCVFSEMIKHSVQISLNKLDFIVTFTWYWICFLWKRICHILKVQWYLVSDHATRIPVGLKSNVDNNIPVEKDKNGVRFHVKQTDNLVILNMNLFSQWHIKWNPLLILSIIKTDSTWWLWWAHDIYIMLWIHKRHSRASIH